ncbi:GNAT family N-acetyltransferase [Alkalinema pantanalense CENA528]|uniref:GNAT family N-acetyltransferase n=1 Tax=Alkalinema pantanalense TaxID=1620705 RepID=UPI003D6EB528
MAVATYVIRTMTRRDLDVAIAWAAAEGWNPGLQDAVIFYAADPQGFLMGWLGEEPIAAISAVKYGDSFGFLGFYIVKLEYRGQGYGIKIWKAALEALSGRTVGLDGVVVQQANYQKSGFTLAYRNIRYQGTASHGSIEHLGDVPVELVPLSTIDFEQVYHYDRPFFPDDRRTFLHSWINQSDSYAIGLVQSGQLVSYGVVRPCQSGYKIGPLFADRPEFAEQLFTALQTQVPQGAAIFLDVPETNGAAVELAQRHHLSIAFETARMYLGETPNLPIDRMFGVTTFELG